MNVLWLFPGQGSQSVGMGVALAEAFSEAREVFGEVDDALKINLFRLMKEGPLEDLTLTENAQPAIMAVSLAVARVLKAQAKINVTTTVRFAAGHSLGEYSAVAALGMLSLAHTAQVLQIRGRAMQHAVPAGQGGMVAVLGASLADVEAALTQYPSCVLANDNAEGQVVLSGPLKDLEACSEVLKPLAKRVLPLPVSAPFHSPAMIPAAQAVAETLALRPLFPQAPYPIISNVTAQPEVTGWNTLLVQQITGRVRWRDIMDYADGQDLAMAVELGHGTVLTNLAKRRLNDVACFGISDPKTLETFVETVLAGVV
ncbi:MAG: ACP S-malonyltransferase [Alphaproteobacteria bacterium]